MLVSCVVPVYEELPRVLKLAKTMLLFRQKHLRDVILVDDHSPTFDLRELLGLPFNIIRNETNLGFCATENVGAKLAQGKYILFLNSDLELHSDWLDPMVDLAESNEKIGIVGMKLVFPPNEQGEFNIQSCGGLYDANRMPFHRYLGWLATDDRVNKEEKVSWTTGAALMVRRDLFEKAGGIDEAYGRGYFDDPDLCERIKELGFEVWYCPKASATHYVGSSMAQISKTDEQKRAASKSFYNNARLFESRWASKITPDVPYAAAGF